MNARGSCEKLSGVKEVMHFFFCKKWNTFGWLDSNCGKYAKTDTFSLSPTEEVLTGYEAI